MADLADARRKAEEALSRVLANAAAIVRLSWSDGATPSDRANLERIKSAAADIAQDHKILRALLAAGPEAKACVPEIAPNPAKGGPPLSIARVLQLAVAALHDEQHHSLAEEVRSVAVALAAPPPSDAVREAWLVAESAPELNPSNYSHDDVCELNEAMIRVTLILRRAMGLGQLDAVRSLIAALSSPAPPAGAEVREAAETLGPRECGGRCHDAVDSRTPCPECAAEMPAPPDGAEIARLTALLRECNAACLCGCPESEHESYGEDGESCGHDDHECLRVAPAVLEIVQRYRVALSDALAQKPDGAEVREAAERLDLIGEAWSCGDTDAKEMYRCGRRLLAALRGGQK